MFCSESYSPRIAADTSSVASAALYAPPDMSESREAIVSADCENLTASVVENPAAFAKRLEETLRANGKKAVRTVLAHTGAASLQAVIHCQGDRKSVV